MALLHTESAIHTHKFGLKDESISPAEILTACESALGHPVTRLTPISLGERHLVYRVKTDTIPDVIIKCALDMTRTHYEIARWLMPSLKKWEIFVPQCYSVDCSRRIVNFDYMITEYIHGESPLHARMGRKLIECDLEGAAISLRQIHCVETSLFGKFRSPFIGKALTWRQHAMDLIHRYTKHIDSIPGWLGAWLQDIKELSEDRLQGYRPQPALCHRDFQPRNLLYWNESVRAVVDWDGAQSSDPLYDVTYFLLNTPLSATNRHRFLRAYGQVDLARMSTYALLIQLERCKYLNSKGSIVGMERLKRVLRGINALDDDLSQLLSVQRKYC